MSRFIDPIWMIVAVLIGICAVIYIVSNVSVS